MSKPRVQRPSDEMIRRARDLRQRSTPAERILWMRLRNRRLQGWKFRRQFPIRRFIADFFCDDARLVIEIDGEVHNDEAQIERDREREAVIVSYGYTVLRFSNEQITTDIASVLKTIELNLNRRNTNIE